jgi:hypothetical protein
MVRMSDRGAAFGLQGHQRLECPMCGFIIEAVSKLSEDGDLDTEPEAPADGSVAVCLACACVAFFADGASRLRLPTADERAELMISLEIQAAVQAITQAREESPGDWPRGPRSPRAAHDG